MPTFTFLDIRMFIFSSASFIIECLFLPVVLFLLFVNFPGCRSIAALIGMGAAVGGGQGGWEDGGGGGRVGGGGGTKF